MEETLVQPPQPRKRRSRLAPLPIRDGLNPSRVRVPADADGMTAGDFLSRVVQGQRIKHPDDNEQALAKRFADGEVMLRNGTVLEPESILSTDDDVYFYRIPADGAEYVPPIPIVFADDLITVFAKPHGLVTIPKGSYISRSLVVCARRATGNNDLVPIHRLDRLTAGLVICVNHPDHRGAYQELFPAGLVEKTYHAVSEVSPGAVLPQPGHRFANRLVKTHGEVQTLVEEGEVNAITLVEDVRPLTDAERVVCKKHVPVLGDGDAVVWTLKPLTGKTHQLRRHLSDAGFPLVGDPIYPDVDRSQLVEGTPVGEGLGLACVGMDFVDPITGEQRSLRYNWLS